MNDIKRVRSPKAFGRLSNFDTLSLLQRDYVRVWTRLQPSVDQELSVREV